MTTTRTMVLALVAAAVAMGAGPAAAIYRPPVEIAPETAPEPATAPVLAAFAGERPALFDSLYGLMPGETYLCGGIDLDGTIGVLPRECVDGGSEGPGHNDPDYLVPLPATDRALADIRRVLEIMRVDAVRGNVPAEPFRGEYVFVRLDQRTEAKPALAVRVPVVGETVHVVGYAPQDAFAAPVEADSYTGTAAFSTPECKVTAVDLYVGAFTTDCVTSIHASGAPVVGADGAVLGLVGWATTEGTNSGILALALDALSHLPPVENK